jgi:hypothetical protein
MILILKVLRDQTIVSSLLCRQERDEGGENKRGQRLVNRE